MEVRDKIYIDGSWVPSTGTGTLEVINSATEEVMGTIPEGTPEDVDRCSSRRVRRVRRSGRRPRSTSGPRRWLGCKRPWRPAPRTSPR